MNLIQSYAERPLEVKSDNPHTRALETTLVRLSGLEHDLLLACETALDVATLEETQVIVAARTMHRHHVVVLRSIIQRLGFAPAGRGDLRSGFYEGGVLVAAETGSVLKAVEQNLHHALTCYDHALESVTAPATVVLQLRQARMNVRMVRDLVADQTA